MKLESNYSFSQIELHMVQIIDLVRNLIANSDVVFWICANGIAANV